MKFRILYDRVLFLIYHHFELKEQEKSKHETKQKKILFVMLSLFYFEFPTLEVPHS